MAWMRLRKQVEVFFRNDDANDLADEIVALTGLFVQRGIPITHAVEPGNLTPRGTDWLKEIKRQYPQSIELVQHGWNHTRYQEGEFDDTRSIENQRTDLRNGKEKLERTFGSEFFPAITFPWHVFTDDSIEAANALGYEVFCSHVGHRFRRRVFDRVGRILGKRQIYSQFVCNHLGYIPGTRLFEIDTSIDLIRQYYGHHSIQCDMYDPAEILELVREFRTKTPVIGILVHHRFYGTQKHLDVAARVLDLLMQDRSVSFTTYQSLFRKYASLRTDTPSSVVL
jgi:hypothetical protein